MARKPTARSGSAKDESRPKEGDIDEGGELVRDKDEKPPITVVHAEERQEEPKPVEKKPDPALEDRLAGMEKEMAATRRRAEEAERRATDAEARATAEAGKATTSQDQALANHERAVSSALDATKAELAAAKKAYAAAMEAGDFAAAGDAQEIIGTQAAMKLAHEAEQKRIEAWKAQPKPKAPETRRAEMPREAVDVRAMPRQARDFLDDHPEFLDDWRLWNKLTRAHGDALDDGLDAYSPEYFEMINERMGTAERQNGRAPGRTAAEDRGRGEMPPSRSGPSTGTRNTSEVALTARERESAHFSWPELSHHDAEVEYARQKVKAIEDGKIGDTRH